MPNYELEDPPEIALSVRQPWAWAIIHADKDIENRAWRRPNPGLAFRGRVAIHAACGMTRAEYSEAREFIDGLGWTCPDPHALFRGGIIGSVEVVDVVTNARQLPPGARWFFGPVGLVLERPKACRFIPAAGQLGFFKWREAEATYPPAAARWMLPQPPKLTETIKRLQPDLFDQQGEKHAAT